MQEHPELSKADKKRLCRMIDCRKLSPDVRAQAISNDRMPLRTIVQLLFVEQERAMGGGGASGSNSAVAPDAIAMLAARKERRTSRRRRPLTTSRTCTGHAATTASAPGRTARR